jgi:hypothetical protein
MTTQDAEGSQESRGEAERREEVRQLLLRVLRLVAREVATRLRSRRDGDARTEAGEGNARTVGGSGGESDDP